MTSLYIFIGIIAFFVITLFVSNYIQRKRGNTQERETPEPVINLSKKTDDGCCGMHEVCEKDSLIAAFAEELERFDDEELDRFRFRNSNSYTDAETEEFREVFYTIIDEEKPRWVRSLQMREIAVPDQIKDEIIIVVTDLRETKMQA